MKSILWGSGTAAVFLALSASLCSCSEPKTEAPEVEPASVVTVNQAGNSPYVVCKFQLQHVLSRIEQTSDGEFAKAFADFLSQHPAWRIVSITPICAERGPHNAGITTSVVVVFQKP